MPDLPRVGISRCLLGDEVRYDGGHKRDRVLGEALGPHVEWIAVCPEVEMGMGTPREPIHLSASPSGVASARSRVRLIGNVSRRDWTDQMVAWRRGRMRELAGAGLAGYVLKAGSPSCGLDNVPIRADGEDAKGRGLFAQGLLEMFPDLPIEDDERLKDAEVRAAFLNLVRTRHRMLCRQNGL